MGSQENIKPAAAEAAAKPAPAGKPVPAAKPGAAAGKPRPKRAKKPRPFAVVMCNGGCDLGNCEHGCAGCGECIRVCRIKAIDMQMNAVARVNQDKCVGCGMCAKACPQEIIQIVQPGFTITARCSNSDKGPQARKVCDASCIACGACERACPADAIHVQDNHAVIDYAKCIACGMCATKCPRGVIRDALGIVAPK